jgi:outer membrane protein assembly factor BamA
LFFSQKHFYLTLFSLLLTSIIYGQDTLNFPVQIDSVVIIGNEHTRAQIILREIPYQFPDTLSVNSLLTIKNRIQNLYLFNRVELQITSLQQKNVLLILVTESWYIFPVPLLFINEHDWSKISFGLQLSHYNFRGRNEKLRLGGWLGYNPAFYASYFNPWIGNKTRIILGTGISKKKIENKIFPFDEDRLVWDATLGRKFTLHFETQLNFALENIKLPTPYETFSISGDGSDLVPILSLQLKWDKRDLFEYPKKGFLIAHNFRKIGFTKEQPNFWRFEFDNRLYFQLYKGLSLGIREWLVINEGELPIYQRVFLGFDERIRGYFYEVFPDPDLYQQYTSTNVSLSSLELRFPILPIRYFSFKNGPLIPSLYKDLKFGISAGIFMDSGIVWQDKREVGLNNLYTGGGVGLHIHLPYIYILRLEFAVNDKGDHQYIIDAGVSF